MEVLTDTDKEEMFEYLDRLRESGVTNMLGAGRYLADEFDMDITTARVVCSEWRKTFSDRHPQG